MMRNALLAAALGAAAASANYFGSPEMAGNSQNLLGWGSPATGTPTIAPSQYRPGQGPGKMVGPVNAFNGQPAYSVSLGGLSSREAVSFPLALNYSGPTRALVEGDHARGQVGWVGLGWNLSTPNIAINHKGTYTTSDDVIYADLGPFGGGQILQNGSNIFFLSSNPYIKFTVTMGAGDYAGQILNWTVQLPDGKKLVFGSGGNSQRTVNYQNNVIKAVPFAGVTTRKFIYRWDITSLSDFGGTNSILFDYDQFTEAVGHGRTYVRDSYIKNIRWNGAGGAEAERYEFVTGAKSNMEYLEYAANEAKDDQRQIETRYLDRINCYKEGVLTHHYKLNHDLVSGGTLISGGSAECLKRRLLSIDVVRYDNGANPAADRGWQFTYHDISKHFLLASATVPDGARQTFTYKEVSFAGKEGDQAIVNDFMKKPDHNTYVTLPADNTALAKWRNVSRCDDRFCYNLIKSAISENAKLYVEIRPNRGNYFDTASQKAVKRFESNSTTSKGSELDLIPAGDYFLWVDYKYGSIDLWEWDDGKMVQRLPFNGDSRYGTGTGTGNFKHNIRVYPGGDYFVVHKTNVWTGPAGGTATPNEIIVVKRLPNGQWTSFNRNASACDFDNKGDYGEAIRASQTTGACMELNTADVHVAASQSYFTATHKGVDVITLYGANQAGNGFANQTSKLPNIGSGQRAGYPMNWEVDIGDLAAARDYFVLFTTNATQSVQAFYYSGDQVFHAGGQGSMSGGSRTIYTSQNYFIEKNASNQFWFWEKRWDGTTVQFVRGTAEITANRPSNYTTRVVLVRTHPKAFTIEFYDHADSIGTRPCVNGTNYASNLYAVHRAHSIGYANRTPSTNGENVFNMSFSGSDDQIFALTGQNSTGGPCAAGQGCTFRYMSIRTHPNDHDEYVMPLADIFPMTPAEVPVLKQYHIVMAGARMAMRTSLDQGMLRVRWEPFQWGGADYRSPTKHFVVDQVTTTARLGGGAKDNITYQYVYDRQTYWRVEFNSNLQTPQFEVCEVKQINSLGANVGGTLTVFHTDVLSKPLGDTTIFLIGNEKSSTTFATASADTVIRSDQTMIPYRASAWPGDLFVNRMYKSTVKHIAVNRSNQGSTTTYHRYNDNNGTPHFTVSAMGPGPHSLSQTLFDGLNLPSQSIQFFASAYPDTALLKTVSTTSALNSQTGFTTLSPVSSSKSVTNSSYLPVRSEIWRDFDDALTEAAMKAGNTPVFNLNEGWIPTSEVSKRNSFNQPTETKTVKSSAAGDESFSSLFYEGRLSLPVATVTNSRLDNCAVLLGENGSANLSGIDQPGRWETPGVTFQQDLAHTGRGSLRVVDNYGPGINLYLKDVRSKNISMTMSVWIYAENNTTPILAVERRNASNALLDVTYGAPADYGYPEAQSRWQRWSVTLTNAQLISGNLFNGANDYLRIWIGTGAPAVLSRRIFVDDIVIMPANADFSASTYDYRGIRTSATGSDHLPIHYDLGVRGEVMGVRDHRKRIFTQQGFHYMGEN